MGKNYMSMFDVIGPIMVGPSSSHTSGAATIAWMARQIFPGTPKKVKFTLYGSFCDTYMGHGTDRALIGGILGYKSDDVRIRDSYAHAKEQGIKVNFVPDPNTEMPHPNTVEIDITGEDGYKLKVRGESLGGGRVRITKINTIFVEFTGEYSTLIIRHLNEPGVAAVITSLLANHEVNIAFMKIFRGSKVDYNYAIVESDSFIPEEIRDELLEYPSIINVEVIEI